MDPKERLARQRKLLQKKLGLDMGAAIGMDTEELFNDEDLDYTCQTSGLRAHGSKATAGSSSRNHMVGVILACRLWFRRLLSMSTLWPLLQQGFNSKL